MEDYMSEADNEANGQYFADLDYFYEQKEIRRKEVEQNKIKKEENRKEQLIRQNKCIDNLKNKLEQKDQRIAELEQELAKYKELQDQLGLKNADEFEWFVMLDLLTDNEKNMHILDLHRELAEIKEKAIVPKFKIGQEVYSVFINRKYMEHNEVCNLEITHIMKSKNGIFYQDNNNNAYWFNEKNTFLTEQEAQEKLKEMNGNE